MDDHGSPKYSMLCSSKQCMSPYLSLSMCCQPFTQIRYVYDFLTLSSLVIFIMSFLYKILQKLFPHYASKKCQLSYSKYLFVSILLSILLWIFVDASLFFHPTGNCPTFTAGRLILHSSSLILAL